VGLIRSLGPEVANAPGRLVRDLGVDGGGSGSSAVCEPRLRSRHGLSLPDSASGCHSTRSRRSWATAAQPLMGVISVILMACALGACGLKEPGPDEYPTIECKETIECLKRDGSRYFLVTLLVSNNTCQDWEYGQVNAELMVAGEWRSLHNAEQMDCIPGSHYEAIKAGEATTYLLPFAARVVPVAPIRDAINSARCRYSLSFRAVQKPFSRHEAVATPNRVSAVRQAFEDPEPPESLPK